ncbi:MULTISPECIES: SGNH/GDSL hydrolase family protein [unclassified Mucilaginibacter]|uniref:SGNH/GDSL hydrolase family protein n=1 Tax=unclassified Mucilaginibacter TaxID=2617802 RepID=UPI000969AB44|nr:MULTISPECIES: SGNH/GDSL hydrolase family protein [unclassified Mucilaginibacter]OJW18591.1 MAG: acylhydrolase [Mucilaginibacter sp. 44-25]PLW88992.1 MAG: acylhydrolase [Mucilaginibacter sp.]PMP66137.1 MAG: acylhydrolase [Mucilaginibacter sp.]HEK21555.1 acylhydrolase [Bacteroidota bacterium]
MKKLFFVVKLFMLSALGAQAQDWPNLAKYQADNTRLMAEYNPGNRVVFMGNSITEFWKTKHPVFFENNTNYIDRGISGQTTPQMLLRFRQDVINLKPAVVTILAGTNDIAGNTGPATLEQIYGNIISMAQLAQVYHIKVILSSILPVYDYPWKKGIEPAGKIVALNNMLKTFAAKNNMYYVDYHSLMKDDRDGMQAALAEDGVHPNVAGYTIMENALQPIIKKALAQPANHINNKKHGR